MLPGLRGEEGEFGNAGHGPGGAGGLPGHGSAAGGGRLRGRHGAGTGSPAPGLQVRLAGLGVRGLGFGVWGLPPPRGGLGGHPLPAGMEAPRAERSPVLREESGAAGELLALTWPRSRNE